VRKCGIVELWKYGTMELWKCGTVRNRLEMHRSDCWRCGKFLNVYPVCCRTSTFRRRVPIIFVLTWSAILRELIYTGRDVVATTVRRVNRRSTLRSCWAAFGVNGKIKPNRRSAIIWTT
jgi:hypothetical protein